MPQRGVRTHADVQWEGPVGSQNRTGGPNTFTEGMSPLGAYILHIQKTLNNVNKKTCVCD